MTSASHGLMSAKKMKPVADQLRFMEDGSGAAPAVSGGRVGKAPVARSGAASVLGGRLAAR